MMQLKLPAQFKNISIVCILVIETLLFCGYFQNNIAPYYPKNWDQLVTYRAVYQSYFAVRDAGVSQLWHENAIWQGAFKGVLVPFVGLASAFLLGPHRLAIGLANLFFFIVGQVGLWRFFERRYGVLAGIVAWGLFLASATHYFVAGGIDDLRFDYAGMVVFGLAFLALVNLLETPTRRYWWLCVGWFGLGLATRSIMGVYLLGMTIILLAIYFWLGRRNRAEQISKKRLRLVAELMIVSMVIIGLFLIANGKQLAGYYGNLKVTPEDSIRQAEFGITSFAAWLLYYPESARAHFAIYAQIAALSIMVFALIWLWRRSQSKTTLSKSIQPISIWLVVALGAAMITIYPVLTLYSPSPVVIGVLTIPLSATLAAWFSEGFAKLESPLGLRLATLAIAILGLSSFVRPMITPKYMNAALRQESKTINRFYADLNQIVDARQDQSLVYWMFPHPGFHPFAFEVYLYEHEAETNVPRVEYILPTIFALTADDLRDTLARADVVVTWAQMPKSLGYEYPSVQSLRTFESAWRGQLATEFVLRQTYAMIDGATVGVYTRINK